MGERGGQRTARPTISGIESDDEKEKMTLTPALFHRRGEDFWMVDPG
jgi:hypothetical protein